MAILMVGGKSGAVSERDVELVATVLEREFGETVVHLDVESFPADTRLSWTNVAEIPSRFIRGERAVHLSEVSAVWNRWGPLRSNVSVPADLDPLHRSLCLDAITRTLEGTLASLDAFLLDPPPRVHAAENRLVQLRLAGNIGLDVPATIVSNSAPDIADFGLRHGGRLVSKMAGASTMFFRMPNGRRNRARVYATVLRGRALAEPPGLDSCPMVFQERVERTLEIRATVVGRRVFSLAIDLRKSKWLDSRRTTEVANVSPFQLPKRVEAKLLAMMEELGLRYAAHDLILTPDGRFVFLECNPRGSFATASRLRRKFSLPVARAIADLLVTSAAPRRAHRRRARRVAS